MTRELVGGVRKAN